MKGSVSFEYSILAGAGVIMLAFLLSNMVDQVVWFANDSKDIVRAYISSLRVIYAYQFISAADTGTLSFYYSLPDNATFNAGTGVLEVNTVDQYTGCTDVCEFALRPLNGGVISGGNVSIVNTGSTVEVINT